MVPENRHPYTVDVVICAWDDPPSTQGGLPGSISLSSSMLIAVGEGFLGS